MRKYNKKLNTDIGLLKQLHAKKDKTEFQKMKAVVMKRHNISKATVYREMKKEVPGFYKKPQYNPPVRPVTLKEARMVRELLIKGTKIQDIQVIMENETGERYSWDRVNMIREAVESEQSKKQKANGKKLEDEDSEPLPPAAYSPADPARAGRHPVSSSGEAPKGRLCVEESGFGEDIRVFLESALNVTNMSKDSFVTVNVKGKPIRLGYQAIKEMMMIAANSENAGGMDVSEHMLVIAMHGVYELLRLYAQGKSVSTADYSNALKVLNDYRKVHYTSISPDFKVTDACLREAAPHLSEAERLLLVHKHHRLIKGATEASDTDMRRLRELAAEEAAENM